MELLHNSDVNGEDWVEYAGKVQESQIERTANLTAAYPKGKQETQQQRRIKEIFHKNIMSVIQASDEEAVSETRPYLNTQIGELTLYEESIDYRCATQKAIKLFKDNPLLPGLIIKQGSQFAGMISRRYLFEQMSRPYSWDLLSKKPILAFCRLTRAEILILPSNTTIVAASRQSLQRAPEFIYEPIVIEDEEGNYKLLDVHQLLLAQSQIHDSATEALRQTEAKYRSIFENAVDGIFQTSYDGKFLNVNPALARLYGYNLPSEVIESFTDISRQLYVEPNRRAEFLAKIEKSESITRFESQIYRKDGSIIWISENVRAVRDANGALLYYEGTAEDITERKEAEEALRQSEAKFKKQAAELEQALYKLQKTQSQLMQSEKMSSLGQLIAGVAHEINNPVNCIYNNLPHASSYIQDLMNLLLLYSKHYPQPSQEIQAEAEAIDLDFLMADLPNLLFAMQQGAERIREIVSSLRNFSRLDEKQVKLADIHQGIDSTLLILQHRLKAKADCPQIKVIKDYGELPLVECYPGQLNQVFMNLLGNAIDALEDSSRLSILDGTKDLVSCCNQLYPIPTIRIHTELVGDYVKIRIADNGPGMTEETRKRLFEPFFTTKPAGKGTGIGLSISCQIVIEKHNGRLNCISAPGEGAEFVIEIPIKHC